MKYLYAGSQSPQRFKLLLSLTRISSDDVLDALEDHLVKGSTEINACLLNGVSKSNFSRAFSKLNDIACTIERIKEIDLRVAKSVK